MPATFSVQKDFNKVLRAAERANDWALRRAGAYVRGIAQHSIGKSKQSSAPGKPPKTRKGLLKKAIIFAVDKKGVNVLIGPSASWIGKIGATHEFGGTEPPKQYKNAKVDSFGNPIKVPGTNWTLGPGGFGPIAFVGVAGTRDAAGKFISQSSSMRYAHLFTMAQVRRAQRIAKEQVPALRFAGKARTYPKRAFMRPALNATQHKIPDFWYQSVRG